MQEQTSVQERTKAQERTEAQERTMMRGQTYIHEHTAVNEHISFPGQKYPLPYVQIRQSPLRRVSVAAAVACVSLLAGVLVLSASGTWSVYTDSMRSKSSADAAGYAMSLDTPETNAEIVQNAAYSYEKLISLRNCSGTALAYNIVVCAEGEDTWPEGLTAVLLTDDGEKADGVVSANTCTFSDESWRLEPGVQLQDVYGLRLNTTYDTTPGDYSFSISSFTYQTE